MDKDLKDFLINEICFEVSDYGIPPEEVNQSLEKLYDDNLDPDENIRNISDILSGEYITKHDKGIAKCDANLKSLKEKLEKADNDYMVGLYKKLIAEYKETKRVIEERYLKLKSMDK